MPLAAEQQKLGLGAEVELYQIDMSALGGPILYYVPMNTDESSYSSISYGGQVYTPFPISAEGFEWKGAQAPAQPTVSVANLDHALTSYVLSYSGLIGATFRRIKTFERFLDGGVEPDANAHFPMDVYRIDRKLVHNDSLIQWQLASWIDQQGTMLPKRVVTRDFCSLHYRNGSTGTFDYSKATCPYTGTAKFTFDNQPTTSVSLDVCAHNLTACKLRFGATAILPFGGFPGVPKFRVN